MRRHGSITWCRDARDQIHDAVGRDRRGFPHVLLAAAETLRMALTARCDDRAHQGMDMRMLLI